MRPRFDSPIGHAPHAPVPGLVPDPDASPDAPAVAALFLGVLTRDLGSFFPQSTLRPIGDDEPNLRAGPNFRLIQGQPGGEGDTIELYGVPYRLVLREGGPVSEPEYALVRAVGAVLGLRHHHLFRMTSSARLELYRGGSEDHYVAAFVDPSSYDPAAPVASRIATTILTLRTAALSTYENHRVSTGALLLGSGPDASLAESPTAPDALPYGVELTSLKSIHRLCDGERTLFLVDRQGRLAGIVDAARWSADRHAAGDDPLCAQIYGPHARATRSGGHVCLVLSANQEIKVFAGGNQVFAFTHGRWRLLDPRAKFAAWSESVGDESLARPLFRAALNLAEERRGALFVVLDDPSQAIGRLIAPSDALADVPDVRAMGNLPSRDPLARRALHYLARGRRVGDLDPAVIEALASIDGAFVVDRSGRMIAFGAILRHDPSDLPGLSPAEGARTTAALAASRFGEVLKISEDGVISCFLNGSRAWDL